MQCRYCQRERSCPFAVEATVADTDAAVTFAFCSPGCLAAWAAPEMDYSEYDVSGDPLDEDGATPPRTGADRNTPSA